MTDEAREEREGKIEEKRDSAKAELEEKLADAIELANDRVLGEIEEALEVLETTAFNPAIIQLFSRVRLRFSIVHLTYNHLTYNHLTNHLTDHLTNKLCFCNLLPIGDHGEAHQVCSLRR